MNSKKVFIVIALKDIGLENIGVYLNEDAANQRCEYLNLNNKDVAIEYVYEEHYLKGE